MIDKLYDKLKDFTLSESKPVREGIEHAEIWYMKPEYFRDGIMGYDWSSEKNPTDPKNLEKTHVHLTDVISDDPEEIYMEMQGERWSPKGSARDLIKSKGLRHTSMSVGDVMVINGTPYMVDSTGFVNLNSGEKMEESVHESYETNRKYWMKQGVDEISAYVQKNARYMGDGSENGKYKVTFGGKTYISNDTYDLVKQIAKAKGIDMEESVHEDLFGGEKQISDKLRNDMADYDMHIFHDMWGDDYDTADHVMGVSSPDDPSVGIYGVALSPMFKTYDALNKWWDENGDTILKLEDDYADKKISREEYDRKMKELKVNELIEEADCSISSKVMNNCPGNEPPAEEETGIEEMAEQTVKDVVPEYIKNESEGRNIADFKVYSVKKFPKIDVANEDDTFGPITAAEDWLKQNGYIKGSMQRDAPIGFADASKYNYISKWRNMNPKDWESLDGVIIPDPEFREGGAILLFFKKDNPIESIKEDRETKIHNLKGLSPKGAYAVTQTRMNIHDGDILLVDGGVAIMVDAWPTMAVGDFEEFHALKPGLTWKTFENGKYYRSYKLALKQEESINEKFREDTTGMSYYDTFLSKSQTGGEKTGADYMKKAKGKLFQIIHIKPLEYLTACMRGFAETGHSKGDAINKLEDLITYMKSTENYQNVLNKMKNGIKFYMPMLEYSGIPFEFTQEGRNRALAAYELEEDEIPVLVVYPANVQERLKAAKAMIPEISEKLNEF
jgi:hypothetical protein